LKFKKKKIKVQKYFFSSLEVFLSPVPKNKKTKKKLKIFSLLGNFVGLIVHEKELVYLFYF